METGSADSIVTTGALIKYSIALLSAAAAVIHLDAAHDHVEHAELAVAFVATAWAQAMWSWLVVTRPTRRVLWAGILLNLWIVLVWAVSRTAGLPVGPEAGSAEPVGVKDAVATTFELLVVVGAFAALSPRVVTKRLADPRAGRRALAAVAAAVFALSVPAFVAAAHEHEAGHAHAHGEAGHGHVAHHSAVPPDPGQLAAIRARFDEYRDIRVARARGWRPEHADFAGTGVHFANDRVEEQSGGRVDVADPQYLMYTRRLTGSWRLVAVAYAVDAASSPSPPTGLTGADWHQHRWNCVVAGDELDDEAAQGIDRRACREMHGEWRPGAVWMTHVWLIDNPDGPFAEEDPRIE
ncbi:MAG TPA: hypothetical protein VGF25_07975 [Thermoleophilaceae bacterium]|jgi:hypothetical protein